MQEERDRIFWINLQVTIWVWGRIDQIVNWIEWVEVEHLNIFLLFKANMKLYNLNPNLKLLNFKLNMLIHLSIRFNPSFLGQRVTLVRKRKEQKWKRDNKDRVNSQF